MRPQIEIRNYDRHDGNVTDKMFVRIGKAWRLFGKKEFDNGGVDWINKQLTLQSA